VRAKNLHGLEVAHRLGLVGDLIRKNTAYDVWALEPAAGAAAAAAAAAGAGAARAPASGSGSGSGDKGKVGGAPAHVGHVGAEELNNLSVLLPCKRKGGQLYLGAYAMSLKNYMHVFVCVRV
jgi:hypothetical protein